MRVLTVPGVGDHASPRLWLARWEREGGWTRVAPPDPADPEPEAWADALRAAVAEAGPPVLLVAHALGCLAVARAGPLPGVAGAFLAAPPDAEQPMTRPEIARFGPGPWEALPFPAVVLASRSDPWCGFARAAALARAWGARLVDAGAAGHLAAADGLARRLARRPRGAGRAARDARRAVSGPAFGFDAAEDGSARPAAGEPPAGGCRWTHCDLGHPGADPHRGPSLLHSRTAPRRSEEAGPRLRGPPASGAVPRPAAPALPPGGGAR